MSEWKNKHYWLLGGIIGLILGVLFLIVNNNCNSLIQIYCDLEDNLSMQYGEEYYILGFLFVWFVLGAFVAWIIGMFKE